MRGKIKGILLSKYLLDLLAVDTLFVGKSMKFFCFGPLPN